MSQPRPVRWRQGVVAGLVGLLVGLWGLTWRGMEASRRELERRHEQVADLLFDEVGRELLRIVDAEEARSFLEYRYAYLSTSSVKGGGSALLRSPLSEPPDEPWIEAYFQIDPDGRLFLPLEPRDWEAEPDATRAAVSPELRRHLEELTQGLRPGDLPAHQGPLALATAPPPPPAEKRAPKVKFSSKYELLASMRSSSKEPTSVKLDSSQASNYAQKGEEPGEETPAEPQAVPPPPREPTSPVSDAGGSTVDVFVSGLQGTARQDELVLWRTVRLGRNVFVQGLVLDQPRLREHLQDTALAGLTLGAPARFAWGGPRPDTAYTFDYALQDPWRVGLSIGLEPLPELGDEGRLSILLAALVATAVGILGAAAVVRTVQTELDLAQGRANFVSAVTHELKTPLTSIRLYAEMLRDGMVQDEAKRQSYYRTISDESERLGRLIQNVLDLGRIERRQLQLEVRPVALEPILARLEALAEPQAVAQGFRWRRDPDTTDLHVEAEPDALEQVLLNVVDNAMKFSRGAASPAIDLRTEVVDGRVVVAIRDHGPGVPPELLHRIFEPFFRGEHELVRKTHGTGIGLALAAGLVRAMGGELRAHNHAGGGLEVEVQLRPAAPAA